MATRTIVTSQPDVACDVCARRLLRGEQPDVFVGAGRRRIVCELCAPRAAHEGWMRETDSQSLSLPPMRARRGRSLFERLPVPFKMRQAARPTVEARQELAAEAAVEREAEPYDRAHEVEPYDVLLGAQPVGTGGPLAGSPDGLQPPADMAVAAVPTRAGAAPVAAPSHEAELVGQAPSETYGAHEERALQEPSPPYLREALAVFNASEFPRRVAGVARSLGAPSVSVRSAEHLSSVVSIVVAWELCWYRYEVDLSEPVVEAQQIEQGTELVQLAREDRLGNAAAAQSGALQLAGAV